MLRRERLLHHDETMYVSAHTGAHTRARIRERIRESAHGNRREGGSPVSFMSLSRCPPAPQRMHVLPTWVPQTYISYDIHLDPRKTWSTCENDRVGHDEVTVRVSRRTFSGHHVAPWSRRRAQSKEQPANNGGGSSVHNVIVFQCFSVSSRLLPSKPTWSHSIPYQLSDFGLRRPARAPVWAPCLAALT